jgi:DNA-binding NarL/FixJ family response regulator
MRRATTLIVDDEEDMRVLLRATIEANPDLAVTAEAATGEEGLERWREHRPGVVVLDQRMPGMSGLETAEVILAEDPDQPIVLFSAYLDSEMRDAASQLGIRACLSKSEFAKIPEVLRACARVA